MGELMLGSTQDLFEMANLHPEETGLPMTVWVSPRGHAGHDMRVKVNTTHGRGMDTDDVAIMGVRPEPRLIEGKLSSADQSAVAHWISVNADVLLDYWDGKIGTIELARRLVPV